MKDQHKDFGEVSFIIDEIKYNIESNKINLSSEAETRLKIIDRIIREICQWEYNQISVEEKDGYDGSKFIDYVLRSRDNLVVIEAKKNGIVFPTPSKQKKLKITGSILSSGEINKAIQQVEFYAESKDAQLIVVTNGECWCFFRPINYRVPNDEYATLLFPLESIVDCEKLFNILALPKVEEGSLSEFSNQNNSTPPKKLILTVSDSAARLDRNNIAEFLSPALDASLYSESILNDSEKLRRCFVSTDGRKKFDSILKMNLVNPKPYSLEGTKKVKKDKSENEISKFISLSKPSQAPPVTLLIGNVGVGKSTFLRHFELVQGKELLKETGAHWVYIDFEKMGKDGNPRSFLYDCLNDYLLQSKPDNPTDYTEVVKPAYEEEIKALARGPYAELAKTPIKFREKVQELISRDFEKRDPYVDKIFKYLAKNQLTVIVLDNIDLYEDSELEARVFSDAIAIAKKLGCYVFVSIRDTTFIEHKNDSIFNAYELKRLWLDPPPFREVLSKRLSVAKKVLEGKSAKIPMHNSMVLDVPDLSVFFEIVQRSLLNESCGHLIEYLSDRNIRRGLQLVTNFLNSGHIQADIALKSYLYEDKKFTFKIHEVFKGSVLGQWKYYQEERAEVINLFDSKIGSAKLLPLRLYILNFIFKRSQDTTTHIVKADEIIKLFTNTGASSNDIIITLNTLQKHSLIKSKLASDIDGKSDLYLNLSGGYYISYLSKTFCYLEAIMMDSSINDPILFEQLTNLTHEIEYESSISQKLKLRTQRMLTFLNYLELMENAFFQNLRNSDDLKLCIHIKAAILLECDALNKISEKHRNRFS